MDQEHAEYARKWTKMTTLSSFSSVSDRYLGQERVNLPLLPEMSKNPQCSEAGVQTLANLQVISPNNGTKCHFTGPFLQIMAQSAIL